jgi:hypothetical protein
MGPFLSSSTEAVRNICNPCILALPKILTWVIAVTVIKSSLLV